MCDGDDGVIRGKVGILNSPLFHRRKDHGGRGKELPPMALNKGYCGRAEAYNQVERTFSIEGTKILANAALGSPRRSAQSKADAL